MRCDNCGSIFSFNNNHIAKCNYCNRIYRITKDGNAEQISEEELFQHAVGLTSNQGNMLSLEFAIDYFGLLEDYKDSQKRKDFYTNLRNQYFEGKVQINPQQNNNVMSAPMKQNPVIPPRRQPAGNPGNYNVNYTPVNRTPVNSTPINRAPVNSTPVNNTPVNRTPVNNTPVNNTPVNRAPVNNTPVNSMPVNNTPVNYTPAYNTPGKNTPVNKPPAKKSNKKWIIPLCIGCGVVFLLFQALIKSSFSRIISDISSSEMSSSDEYNSLMEGAEKMTSLTYKDGYPAEVFLSSDKKDHFDNEYYYAISNEGNLFSTDEAIGLTYDLNGQYSKFRGTLYVPKEITFTSPVSVAVLADGEKVFSSTITDSSVEPSDIDVDISGCKTFQICFSRQGKKYETDSGYVCLGNPRFYK